MNTLKDFLRESNAIEGIHRPLRNGEIDAARNFLALSEVTAEALSVLVHAFEPGANLRQFPGMDVRVAAHIAPPGGPEIVRRLDGIIGDVNINKGSPYENHIRYEMLHPFMDGNGRSGRMLWAWQMIRFKHRPALALKFLHAFYYQTLEANQSVARKIAPG